MGCIWIVSWRGRVERTLKMEMSMMGTLGMGNFVEEVHKNIIINRRIL